MVRKGYNLTRWLRNHQLLKTVLLQNPEGIRKQHLANRTNLSRPTVDDHIEAFEREGKIIKRGYLLFWKHNYEELLRRKQERIHEMMREESITMQAIGKLIELSGKELLTWDADKFMEDLRRKRKMDDERRKVAMTEYAKKHPVPEIRPVEVFMEYVRRFEEYYEREWSADSAEEGENSGKAP